jgi:hypothetical protein
MALPNSMIQLLVVSRLAHALIVQIVQVVQPLRAVQTV